MEVEGGDLIPFNVNSKDLQDEVNSRTHKAGYTNRQGEKLYRTKIMPMPPNDKYRENYFKIFGHN